MTSIKRKLRKHEKPLQQLIRYSEMENVEFFPLKNSCYEKYFYVNICTSNTIFVQANT